MQQKTLTKLKSKTNAGVAASSRINGIRSYREPDRSRGTREFEAVAGQQPRLRDDHHPLPSRTVNQSADATASAATWVASSGAEEVNIDAGMEVAGGNTLARLGTALMADRWPSQRSSRL